jgi:hypothetical protein
MHCKNCSTLLLDHYCSHCGQIADVKRITMGHLVKDAFFSGLHVEKKGLPSTLKVMASQPGKAIREYMEGKRIALYPPFKFLFLSGTITTILTARYNFFSNELTKADSIIESPLYHVPLVKDNVAFFDAFFKYAEHYATLLNIIAVPIFAFFSWLLFRKRGFNFGENLILNIYITGFQLFVLILLAPFIELFPQSKHILIPAYTVITIVYNIWVYITFFQSKLGVAIFGSVLVVYYSYVAQLFVNLGVFYLLQPIIHLLPKLH